MSESFLQNNSEGESEVPKSEFSPEQLEQIEREKKFENFQHQEVQAAAEIATRIRSKKPSSAKLFLGAVLALMPLANKVYGETSRPDADQSVSHVDAETAERAATSAESPDKSPGDEMLEDFSDYFGNIILNTGAIIEASNAYARAQPPQTIQSYYHYNTNSLGVGGSIGGSYTSHSSYSTSSSGTFSYEQHPTFGGFGDYDHDHNHHQAQPHPKPTPKPHPQPHPQQHPPQHPPRTGPGGHFPNRPNKK